MPGAILHHALRARMALDDLHVALQNETAGKAIALKIGPSTGTHEEQRLQRLDALRRGIESLAWLDEVIKAEL